MVNNCIYLAGGFHDGWGLKVSNSLPEYTILDPSLTGLLDPIEYTKWDLEAVRESDIVLAYIAQSNPAGYNLALEVGYAHALGKQILVVYEPMDGRPRRYFSMTLAVADMEFETLDDAIAHLREMAS